MYYLDGLASWPMRPEAKGALIEALAQPGNSNSNHVAGWQANSLYERGRRAVAALIGAAPNEIFITSGATEANALAIMGTSRTLVGKVPDRKKSFSPRWNTTQFDVLQKHCASWDSRSWCVLSARVV